MRVAWTGEEVIPQGTEPKVLEAVDYVVQLEPTHIITGAAKGVDTLAALECLKRFPNSKHTLFVPNYRHNEELVELFSAISDYAPGWVKVVVMPSMTDPLDRNQAMIDNCDVLIACPRTHREVDRSGTWATVRRGRRADRTICYFPLLRGVPWVEKLNPLVRVA